MNKLKEFTESIDVFNAHAIIQGHNIAKMKEEREAIVRAGMGLGIKKGEVDAMLAKVYGRVVAPGDVDAAGAVEAAQTDLVNLANANLEAINEANGDPAGGASQQAA